MKCIVLLFGTARVLLGDKKKRSDCNREELPFGNEKKSPSALQGRTKSEDI